MKSAVLIQALTKKFGQTTDKALSQILGITPQTLSNWRNGGEIQPMQVARLAFRLANKAVVGEQLVAALQKKLGGSEGEVAAKIGRSPALVSRLKRERTVSAKRLPPRSSLPAMRHAVKQIRRQSALHELAHYVSAYHVTDGMVNDVEALLVRSFANNLLNKRIEKFSAHRPGIRKTPPSVCNRPSNSRSPLHKTLLGHKCTASIDRSSRNLPTMTQVPRPGIKVEL